MDNGGNSYYNGLAVQIQRRLVARLHGRALLHVVARDRQQHGQRGGNLFLGNNAPSTLFNGDYHGKKGDSSLDQRQRLVINWVWSPTFTTHSDWASPIPDQ